MPHLGITLVDEFSADSHAFEQRPCFVPYHFYSKIGIKHGFENFNNGLKTLEAFD